MAKIKIGGAEFSTRRPTDLDAQLLATTGCHAREIETILAAGNDRVAAALRPFLPNDAPSVAEIASAIADDRGIVETVRGLYADVDQAPAKQAEAGKDG